MAAISQNPGSFLLFACLGAEDLVCVRSLRRWNACGKTLSAFGNSAGECLHFVWPQKALTFFAQAACLKGGKSGKYQIEPVSALKTIRLRSKTLLPQATRLRIAVTAAILVCGAVLLLYFGGYALVATDPLPDHADVAVMLAGGINSEEARMAEAIRLLHEGRVDHVMLSVGGAFFLGEWLPDLLLRYVKKEYGTEVARNVVLCELNNSVNSTAGEASTLRRCLEARGWRSVIVVTSNFHTRRARLMWRATLAGAEPPFMLSVRGVPDGDFEPDGWWRRRRYAKTWLLEFTKLLWSGMLR